MMDNPWILFVVIPLVAYGIGAIPFGVLIARSRGVDLRKTGSGNVGATNVGRVLGRRWGYLCFALDVAKGFLPVLIVGLLLRPQQGNPEPLKQLVWLLAGCGAILGHVFSFWLGFRGGKGVATALGVVLGIYPYFTYAGGAALAVWIAVTLVSRYVSLGSIIAAVAFVPLFALLSLLLGWSITELWPLVIFAAAMVVLIIVRHRTNIGRLLNGAENKIGSKSAEK
jgi:glycerol-3-phosphate acyltransferase PlsY